MACNSAVEVPHVGLGRREHAATLASLKAQRAAVNGERRPVASVLGPVRYLSTLIGATDEEQCAAILVVALPLDPVAVLLLRYTRPTN